MCVSLLDGISPASARGDIRTGAPARAFLSAAAAIGLDPQVHGGVRAARIAAARPDAGDGGAAAARSRRSALHLTLAGPGLWALGFGVGSRGRLLAFGSWVLGWVTRS